MSDFKIKGKYIGCFSDIHIGLYQNSEQWHKIVLDFAKWASSVYLKVGINDIIIPGDIFHNRNEIGVNTLAVAKKFFDYFKDFRIFISSGNHDCFYKNNSTVNSISIFDGWNNIHVIDNTPTTIKTDYKDIVLVPWGVEYKDIPKTDGIIFGHFEINSFYMNSYKVCDHGLSSKDLFQKSSMIISGHFHKKDHRKYDNGEIVYLGSPYQQNFGDTNDERGIYVLNLENKVFNFVENKISPKHIKISLKDYEKNHKIDNIENNIISLIVDDKIDQEKISLYSSNIQKLSPISFRMDYLESKSEISIGNTEETDTGDLLKDIQTFVENLDVEHKKEVVDYLTESYNILIK
jgi:DNA repair exonuclease SbcCD nuclease subunit